MFAYLCLALGLVLILEGPVYVLAPSIVERLLETMREMSLEARRLSGLVAVLTGVCLLILAKTFGVLG